MNKQSFTNGWRKVQSFFSKTTTEVRKFLEGKEASKASILPPLNNTVPEPQSAAQELPKSHRDVLFLAKRGIKNKEIARQLGMNPSTVGTIIFRARQKGFLPKKEQ